MMVRPLAQVGKLEGHHALDGTQGLVLPEDQGTLDDTEGGPQDLYSHRHNFLTCC